ncbi:hypothetical protein K1F50_06945 [Muricauda oceani]|uniref:DUF6876 domain-containing protein n=1 Tax=Flagellimonas oceani TaxID=2698672 RepID=A0A6G7J6X7_9FLAO|nr:DUF6876 family protein [Allomuricauda oceani]MBW8242534.1 hypothetical protein [Allomuricauda oceani]QII46294.1 hypothetical protein GVT53_16930 [Allomuricauda oceani]
METNIQKLQEQLSQFCGSQQIFTLPLCRTRYTEGIQFLAQTANAFWLLTDASVMGKSLMSKSRFITIDFKRYSKAEAETHGYDAVIAYSDGNGTVFTEQRYHTTDFPLEQLCLFFVDNTLLLPSEY